MTGLNLDLVAATYPDVTSAGEGDDALRAAEKEQDGVAGHVGGEAVLRRCGQAREDPRGRLGRCRQGDRLLTGRRPRTETVPHPHSHRDVVL